MKVTIYRGTEEIGGTLIEIKTDICKIVIDAGYPLFLKGEPINDTLINLPSDMLLQLGVIPKIKGLFKWDVPEIDAVIISHAHQDHYGLLKYIHPDIPIYVSRGTQKLIELTKLFIGKNSLNDIAETEEQPTYINFDMGKSFDIKDISFIPHLMDHSAFDSAAIEIKSEGKTIIYTGDFRGHGRKAICLDKFIKAATPNADVLLIEGTMLGRQDEKTMTEEDLEKEIKETISKIDGPALFQSSSQNIDRLVSLYKAASSLGKIFIVDVYTANILYELRMLGTNHIPYPSKKYENIKVFYPWRMTEKICKYIDRKYAYRFSSYRISREEVFEKQKNIVMLVRPSMQSDLTRCNLTGGIFIYSLWEGYRQQDTQQKFENYLIEKGFQTKFIHTSGHATTSDIQRLMTGIDPKIIIPIHTMYPKSFLEFSDKIQLQEDGKEFLI